MKELVIISGKDFVSGTKIENQYYYKIRKGAP
jgi:hypothetical protein